MLIRVQGARLTPRKRDRPGRQLDGLWRQGARRSCQRTRRGHHYARPSRCPRARLGIPRAPANVRAPNSGIRPAHSGARMLDSGASTPPSGASLLVWGDTLVASSQAAAVSQCGPHGENVRQWVDAHPAASGSVDGWESMRIMSLCNPRSCVPAGTSPCSSCVSFGSGNRNRRPRYCEWVSVEWSGGRGVQMMSICLGFPGAEGSWCLSLFKTEGNCWRTCRWLLRPLLLISQPCVELNMNA